MSLLLALALAVAVAPQTRDIGARVDALAGRQGAQSQTKPPAKTIPAVVAALEQSEFRYRRTTEGVWSVTFKGDNLASVDVSIHALDEMVVIVAVVSQAPALSRETLHALLRASYEANLSKIAIDKDGDVVALTELPKDFTPAALKNAVRGVATLADDSAALLGTADTLGEEAPPVAPGRGATLSLLRGAFELSYDPAKWRVKTTTEPGVTELQHASGDAGLKVITERLEIPRASFRSIVLENAKELAPDIAMMSETPRRVNGLEVVLLRYGGTTKGIKFTFCNQMYSDASGTIQLAGWTGTNLFDEFEQDFLQLFAGLRKVR